MRRILFLVLASSMALAGVVAACKQNQADEQFQPVDDAGQVIPPVDGDDDDDAAVPGPPEPAATGLPCDVETLLENRCSACHGAVQPKSAPLITFDDLKAKSTRDATKSQAEVSVALMKAKAMPPPPAQPADDEEIAVLEEWVKAGMPKNPKSCIQGALDGGVGTDAGKADGGDGGSVCTSGKTYAGGNNETMRPGEACLTCHGQQSGERFFFAGTVYPTLHEPNLCNGSPPPVTVTITNGIGQTRVMQVNEVGNFFTRQRLNIPPFTVSLTSPKGTRVMQQTINGGDCNACHTQEGTTIRPGTPKAPGRIMAP